MSGGLKVTVAGLDFFGQGLHDFVIDPDGFDGWDDGVEMRLEQLARPQAHGSFDLPGFQDARTVSISGHVFTDSNSRLRLLRSRLTGLLADGGLGRVQVERDGEVLWADCRLASRTKFTELGGQNVASFQIQLWCADPLKFGDVTQFPMASNGDYVTLFHRGNTVAYPRVVISGSASGGYQLRHPDGAVYNVTRALTSGATHEVDMRTGLLRVGGVVDMTGVTGASVWHVPPGNFHYMKVLPLGAGSATAVAHVTDTYI